MVSAKEAVMKKTILTYGLISGALSAAMMFATLPMLHDFDYRRSEIIGYTSILLASLLVFFGVRSYRETAGGGRLTFLRGLGVGVAIAAISAVCYAATWLVISTWIRPGMTAEVAAWMVKAKQASGASAAEVAETAHQAEVYARLAKNPAINFGMTLLEPFPVGLAMSVLSALILRRRRPAGEPATA
jgi:hypothetical protein